MYTHRFDDLAIAPTAPAPAAAPGKVATTSRLAPRRDPSPAPADTRAGASAAATAVHLSAAESRIAALSGVSGMLEAGDADAIEPPTVTPAPAGDGAAGAKLPFTIAGFPSSVAPTQKQPTYSGTPLPGAMPPLWVYDDVVFTPSIVNVLKVIAAAGYGEPSKKDGAKAPVPAKPAAPGAPAAPSTPKAPAPAAAVLPVPPALLAHAGEAVHRAGDPYAYQVTADGNFLITAAPAGMPAGATIKQKGGMITVWQDLCKAVLGPDCFTQTPAAPAPASAAAPASADPAAPAAPAAKATTQWTLDGVFAAIWGTLPTPPDSLKADADALLDFFLGVTPPTAAATAPAAAAPAETSAAEPAPDAAPAAPKDAPYLPGGTPVSSGLRTDEDQAKLIVRHAQNNGLLQGGALIDGDLHKTWVALRAVEQVAWVGDSLHRSGLAIDFSTSKGGSQTDILAGLNRLKAEHPELGLGDPYPEHQPCVHLPLTK